MNRRVAIVTDSTASVPVKIAEALGIAVVTIVAFDENWSATGYWIHECFGWKLRLGPFGFIPSAAQNPFSFRRPFHMGRDPS